MTCASGTSIEIRASADRETPIIFVGMPGALVVKAFAEHNNYSKSRIYLGDLSDFIGKEVKEVDIKGKIPDDKKEETKPEAETTPKDDKPEAAQPEEAQPEAAQPEAAQPEVAE